MNDMANAKYNHPHGGHRERMRNRVDQNGFVGFQDHEILEFMLFNVIPREDTNDLAHELLEHFGSLDRVFAAQQQELVQVKGIGEKSARFLKSIGWLIERLNQPTPDRKDLSSVKNRCQYFQELLSNYQEERAYVACLDDTLHLVNGTEIGKGATSAMQINMQDLIRFILCQHCSNVILAHCHPMGEPVPSREDIYATSTIKDVLSSMGIRLVDHIIVAGSKAGSMAQMGSLHMC